MLLYSVTLKKLYPLSAELNPFPGEVVLPRLSVVLAFCSPSIKILSPALNGGVINPATAGVVTSSSTIPFS